MTPDSAKALTPTERLKLLADLFADDACAFLSEESPSSADEAKYYAAKAQLHVAIDALAASPDSAPAQEAVARVVTVAQGANRGKQVLLLRDVPNESLLYLATLPAQEAAVTQQPAESRVLSLMRRMRAAMPKGHWEDKPLKRMVDDFLMNATLAAPIAPEPAQPQAAGGIRTSDEK